MKFTFHRWIRVGHEIEVEANSVAEAMELVEREVETESVSDMETEDSGLDLVP